MSTPSHRWRQRRAAPLVVALAASLGLVACGDRGAESVVIGVGSTDEQQVLAALASEALGGAGVPVALRPDLGNTIGLRREALAREIHLFWDYTGAAWALGLREPAPPADPLESWERVRQVDERRGLEWLEPTSANATLALFVHAGDLPSPDAQRNLSWLARELSSGQRRLCADPDFIRRDAGLPALAAEYGIHLTGLPTFAVGEAEAIRLVQSGQCFAGLATATSGRARNASLVPVEDELNVFPAFIITPVVRRGSPADAETVRAVLQDLTRALDTATVAGLNARVAAGDDPADVAAAFIADLSAASE